MFPSTWNHTKPWEFTKESLRCPDRNLGAARPSVPSHVSEATEGLVLEEPAILM